MQNKFQRHCKNDQISLMMNSSVIPAGNGGVSHYYKCITFDESPLFFSGKMKHCFNPHILPSLTFISQITSGNGIRGWIFWLSAILTHHISFGHLNSAALSFQLDQSQHSSEDLKRSDSSNIQPVRCAARPFDIMERNRH